MNAVKTQFYPDGKLDLDNCHREPIHIPGAIQPHGVLLALTEPDLRIVQLSSNAEAVLGGPLQQLRESLISQFLDDDSFEQLRRALSRPRPEEENPLRLTTTDGREFDGIIHRSGGLAVLELEVSTSEHEVGFSDFYRQVRLAVERLRKEPRLLGLCRRAADEVRRLTGFDRVMVYRFDHEWNGEVVAEAREESLEPYLGLHYPAADIPPQARQLYVLNWLRLISDIHYQPAHLIPQDNPLTGDPLDLSQSVLRSVSPIHIAYLDNMGVCASMSISLVVDGQLWGLIACHHYSPRFVSYEIRQSCEFLGQALSWQVAARERAEDAERLARASRIRASLMEQLSTHADPAAALTRDPKALLDLVSSQSAVALFGSSCRTLGDAPDPEQVRALAECLEPLMTDGLFHTDRAADLVDPESCGQPPPGILAIRVSVGRPDIIMWFCPEIIETVRWGSRKTKEVSIESGLPRLSPEGSFEVWEETVRGRSERWEPWQVAAARELRQGLLALEAHRAQELASRNRELREASRAKDEFLATLSHELRNPLNAILGWTQLMIAGGLPEGRQQHALEVLQRNAQLQSQLIDDLLDLSRIIRGQMRLEVQPVDLKQVIENAVETVSSAAEAKSIQIQTVLDPKAGPILGDPDRLQQIIWNLLSNAIKFTDKKGRVRVAVQKQESSVVVRVEDNGAGIPGEELPHLFDRFLQGTSGKNSRRGLGLGLSIVRSLTELHGGTVEAESQGAGHGSAFVVRLPLSPVRSEQEIPSTLTASGTSLEDGPSLAGLRVLIVDDDPDARDFVSTALKSAGADTETAASGREALEVLDERPPTVLVCDIGMPEMDGYEVLQELRRRRSPGRPKIPAIALTAYARPQDRAKAFRAGFQTHVAKPVDIGELVSVVAAMAGRV